MGMKVKSLLRDSSVRVLSHILIIQEVFMDNQRPTLITHLQFFERVPVCLRLVLLP